MIENYVSAAIAHQVTSIKGVDQLEGGKFVAPRGAGERFRDPRRANAVAYVNYSGEFFELSEKGEGDVGGGLLIPY